MMIKGQLVARIRILVADDHRLVLAGLKALVRDEPTIEVIGEAIDGQSALRLASDLKPDVVVLDLSMPGKRRSGGSVAPGTDATMSNTHPLGA